MKTSLRESRPGAQAALVARQPIFDSRFTVIAHELLYRTETKSDSSLPRDGGLATARVIVHSCLEIGLDRLTGAVPAHINFPRELLVGNAPLPVDPHRVVIEVLEDVRADSDVINALSTWRQRGHRIALDDFSFEESDTGLLAFAHIVKLDVQQLSLRRFERTYEELRNRKLILIAEKVETVEEFERCKALGFDAFQGYFLGRPELFRGRRVPTNRFATFCILAELQNPEVDAAALEQLVARDAGADPVVRALLHGEGDLARKLRCVQDYEAGGWDALGGYGLSNEQLLTAYIDALEWADGATSFLAPMHA